MTWHCSGHKLHSIADKTWELARATLSGMCATLLSLQTAQQISRLKAALEQLVRQRCRILRESAISEAARQHRQTILDLYLPQPKHARKRAIVLALACVCNADWRVPLSLDHICAGTHCCKTPADTATRVVTCILKFTKSLRPNKLCRANWLEWRRPLAFIGILGHLHGLLADAMQMAMDSTKVCFGSGLGR